MHAHDDLGLATANTLAAARAGATHVNTTVNGLGERAGNAALEEVVHGLRQCHGVETGVDLRRFPALSALVAQASGRPVSWQKSLVGEGVFTHEAGIHVDGLLKHPDNYQGFDPQLVGRDHRVVLGKHSGKGGVQAVYSMLGRPVNDDEAEILVGDIRDFVNRCKRPPSPDELLSMLARPPLEGGGRLSAETTISTGKESLMNADTTDFALEIAELESAEDFLGYFNIAYDQAIVQINRLHILQRFHDYLTRCAETQTPTYAEYRTSLGMAYDDFVRADAMTEKVFKVFKRAAGIATVPLSAIGRAPRR